MKNTTARTGERRYSLALEKGGREIIARKNTLARMHECTNARMHECTNARMHECTNARMHERTKEKKRKNPERKD
ncbi:MAG: hypothetical protein ACTSU9_03535 [Promethearchaeota archaeon]